MKLLFVLPHLRAGGAQRVAVNLINHLDNCISLTLFLINDDGFLIDYIEKDIEIITSKTNKSRKVIFELKDIIDHKHYDVVFTMKNYLGFVVCIAKALSKSKPPIIYREVTHKSAGEGYENTSLTKRKIWYLIERYVYNKVSNIIVPTDMMKQDLMINYSIPQSKINVINNPVDIDLIQNLANQVVEHPWFESTIPVAIGMGRLTAGKGFHELINAVNIVAEKNTPLKLLIIGEGEEKSKLQKLVEELGLQDAVKFLGSQDNPYKYISKADVFVLSSFYEGFPNSLIEAMACNTPVISTDCLSGPSEIINNGENGLMVPVGDPEKIAEGIINIIEDPRMAEQISANAKKTVMEKYSADIITKQYQAVFAEIAK